jgi:hypothetical protein
VSEQRPTPELLLLMVAGTICGILLSSAVAVAVIEIRDPGADTSWAAASIRNVLGTALGLMAGYLAGRRGHGNGSADRP